MLREFKDYPGQFDLSFKYSIAHMYSLPNPPFIQPVLQRMPPGLKTWLTVRNDDIYSFRWGDPDFARQYVLAMPAADRLAGFYMGPDGYCWGREFIDRDPCSPRQLVIQKQWYSFMLWGRLSYDPAIPDSHFERVLAGRFPDADAAKLFAAVQESSRTIPLVTRFHWENLDFQWFPEACISHPRYKGFHTVRHFMTGKTMAGSGIMTVRQYVDAQREGQPAPTGGAAGRRRCRARTSAGPATGHDAAGRRRAVARPRPDRTRPCRLDRSRHRLGTSPNARRRRCHGASGQLLRRQDRRRGRSVPFRQDGPAR
jgi:hypothetical protein